MCIMSSGGVMVVGIAMTRAINRLEGDRVHWFVLLGSVILPIDRLNCNQWGPLRARVTDQ